MGARARSARMRPCDRLLHAVTMPAAIGTESFVLIGVASLLHAKAIGTPLTERPVSLSLLLLVEGQDGDRTATGGAQARRACGRPQRLWCAWRAGASRQETLRSHSLRAAGAHRTGHL